MKIGLLLSLFFSMVFLTGSSNIQTKTIGERLGYPPDAKLLIVHADDLGMAQSVNAASIKALETGLVTSASIMVPCPWFSEIATYARKHPQADLGLHLTLTSEWTTYKWGSVLPKDRVRSLLNKEDYFHLTESEAAAKANVKEVEAEIRAQIERARAFGIQPTHLDSHMGTLYQSRALFETFLRVSRENRLLVRVAKDWFSTMEFLKEIIGPDEVVIDQVVSIGPDVTPENWSKFYSDAIKNMQPGVTEIIVHLGYDDAEMRGATFDHPDWGAAWRQRDFDYFTSDTFRQIIKENNIKLITWRDIGKLVYP